MSFLLASTGAFIGRMNGRDYRLIEKYAPEIECDGFELMGYEGWFGDSDSLVGYIKGLPYRFPTLHCDKTIGEYLTREMFDEAFERFRKNCYVAEKIGAKLLIIHLWNGPISDSNISANIKGYARLLEIARDYGLTATVENVIANGGSPLRHWHTLAEKYPDVTFTYDTKMAQFDFDNEKAFLPENIGLWKNVRHVHLNDRIGGYRDWSSYRALNIGAGDVDFKTFFAGLDSVGYSGGYTVEANAFRPDGTLDLDGLNKSLRAARRLIEGRKMTR